MAKISFTRPGAPGSMVPAKTAAPPAAPAPVTQPTPATPAPQPPPAPTPSPAPETAPIPAQAPPPSHGEQVAQGAVGALPTEAPPDIPPAGEGTATTEDAPPPPAFYDGDEGSFDPGDLILPRLNIVQNVGDLSTVHPRGSIVLGGQLVINKEPVQMAVSATAVRLVVIGLQPTTYAEKLPGGARGNYFRTKQEVAAAGGTLDWNEAQVTEKQLYQNVSIGLVAIQQPEGVDGSMFPHTFDGKNYALSLFTMKGTLYTNAAKVFKSARKIGWLRDNGDQKGSYRYGNWLMYVQLKKFGTNYSFIPVLKPGAVTTDKFRADLKALLGF